MPAICQPSTNRLPRNGRSHAQLRISRCFRWKSDSPLFSSGRVWSWGTCNSPLVGEVVDGSRERVVHVEHVALREPLLEARLQRVVPAIWPFETSMFAPSSSSSPSRRPAQFRRDRCSRRDRRARSHPGGGVFRLTNSSFIRIVVVAGEPSARHSRRGQEPADRGRCRAPDSG